MVLFELSKELPLTPKQNLNVHFIREHGIDEGGLSRECMTLIMQSVQQLSILVRAFMVEGSIC